MNIQSIKFEGLVFGHEGQDPLFDKVDFEFPLNDLIWVKAHSGSGRSSLLQLMAGLAAPTQGKYLLNDQNVADMSFEEFLPYRINIGYGFDFGGLINNRTLQENVTLPLTYHKLLTPSQANERAEFYFEVLGATRFKDKRPAVVPGGIRKLTCLIRALVTEPQVLLLDDPSVGLGQETILTYFDCVQELRKKDKCQHVFISSFDDKMMSCLEHQEIFIDCGQIYSEIQSERKKVVNL